MKRIEKLWRNWTVHNLISHPLSEVVWLVTRSEKWSGWVHDVTVPEHEKGTGRG
jgi:hypothetical protein